MPSYISRWDPFRDVVTLREAMDRLFEDSVVQQRRQAQQAASGPFRLPVDAYVTQDSIVVVANVPGVKPEDVEIVLEGDTLTIRGEIKPSQESKNYLLRERASGRFERVLTINTPIEVGKVEATFEDGIVRIVLPKAEAVKPKQIKVNAVKNVQSNGQK